MVNMREKTDEIYFGANSGMTHGSGGSTTKIWALTMPLTPTAEHSVLLLGGGWLMKPAKKNHDCRGSYARASRRRTNGIRRKGNVGNDMRDKGPRRERTPQPGLWKTVAAGKKKGNYTPKMATAKISVWVSQNSGTRRSTRTERTKDHGRETILLHIPRTGTTLVVVYRKGGMPFVLLLAELDPDLGMKLSKRRRRG